MELILVRHTSVDVPTGVCYGQSDVPVKASFPQEADRVRATLAQESGNQPFEAVYTSPLSRCTRLAEWCGYGDAIRDARLMEMNFGSWELQPWDGLPDPETKAWFDDWIRTAPPGGESFLDQRRRVAAWLEEVRSKGYNRVLAFCHGGVIACAYSLCSGWPMEEVFKNQAPYGGVVRFEA